MARTPAQRGRLGNWLVESRMARGWATQQQARAEIERLTGWRIPQSVYAEWESGRRTPSEANEARLREFYGGEPDELPTSDAVALAIDRQTAALVKAIEDQGVAQAGALADLSKALLGALAQLLGSSGRSPDGRSDEPEGRPVAG